MIKGFLVTMMVTNMLLTPTAQEIDFRPPGKIVEEKIAEKTKENEAIRKIIEKEKRIREVAKKHKEKMDYLNSFFDIQLTYYTEDESENTPGHSSVTCLGKKLEDGMVASNYYPLGTQFEIDGKIYTVSDTGGPNFNSPYRLDVFLPCNAGESIHACKQRAFKLGNPTVKARIIKGGI